MNREEELLELLVEWDAAVKSGRELRPEELAPDDIELRDLLKEAIAAYRPYQDRLPSPPNANRERIASVLSEVLPLTVSRHPDGPPLALPVPMLVTLSVVAGPHAGKEFRFEGRDTFLVGRATDCHFRLSHDDPYFSRRHFLVEIIPPRCRVTDLQSRNGTYLNGSRVEQKELRHGDEIRAGHTTFRVHMEGASEGPSTWSAAPPNLSDASLPPVANEQQIAGFRLLEELGRGHMGVVHRAIRLADQAVVAIKQITATAGASDRSAARFVREATVLGQLRHPNIVGFLGGGASGARIYLVMEYLTGPDLAGLLKKQGPRPVGQAVKWICQVLDGLQYAHDCGFVHRDIKPGNIVLHQAPNETVAKLADFGLARAFEASWMSGLTMQGEVGGTPAFMAPEQVTHYRDVSPAADQYSVAATLYNLLTNEVPHDLRGGPALAFVRVLTAKPIPIQDWRPKIDPGLAGIIHRALAREVADRFPSAKAFRQALLPFAE